MKLEDQVCSLEQAKQLKALGVAQQSLFHHRKYCLSKKALRYPGSRKAPEQQEFMDISQQAETSLSHYTTLESYSAFTVAELGAMLPEFLGEQRLQQWRNPEQQECRVVYEEDGWDRYESRWPSDDGIIASTEAGARAALLIRLLRDGKLTAEQVNYLQTQA